MSNADLVVACDDEVRVGTDMEFRASRRSAPAADQWVLCVSTDWPVIYLSRVEPAADTYILDRDGVLGLQFSSSVTAVRLKVAACDLGLSEWRFWVDDGQFDADAWTNSES